MWMTLNGTCECGILPCGGESCFGSWNFAMCTGYHWLLLDQSLPWQFICPSSTLICQICTHWICIQSADTVYYTFTCALPEQTHRECNFSLLQSIIYTAISKTMLVYLCLTWFCEMLLEIELILEMYVTRIQNNFQCIVKTIKIKILYFCFECEWYFVSHIKGRT